MNNAIFPNIYTYHLIYHCIKQKMIYNLKVGNYFFGFNFLLKDSIQKIKNEF